MVQNAKGFELKYGWQQDGHEEYAHRIQIGDRSFAVLAYSQYGFIGWSIYESTVTQYEVISFITSLHNAGLITDRSFCTMDNARNQKTSLVKAELRLRFDEQSCYCSAYCPFFKPIEKGFANVKLHIQQKCSRCHQDIHDPIEIINNAFEVYSASGEKGH
jgi:hypothetical protein